MNRQPTQAPGRATSDYWAATGGRRTLLEGVAPRCDFCHCAAHKSVDAGKHGLSGEVARACTRHSRTRRPDPTRKECDGRGERADPRGAPRQTMDVSYLCGSFDRTRIQSALSPELCEGPDLPFNPL